jgi:hypothetical protein
MQQQRTQAGLGMMPGAISSAMTPVNWSSFASMAQTPGAAPIQTSLNFGGAPQVQAPQLMNQAVTQQLYGATRANLDPQWQQAENTLQTQLANQGITPGSQAWQRQMTQFQTDKARAYQQAQAGATGMGISAAADLFNMQEAARRQAVGEIGAQGAFVNQAAQQAMNQNLALAQYQNQLRERQAQEAVYRQQQPLSLASAFMGQPVGMPTFPGGPTAAGGVPPQLLTAEQQQWGAARDLYNLGQAQQNQWIQAGGGILGSLLGGPVGGAIGSAFSPSLASVLY